MNLYSELVQKNRVIWVNQNLTATCNVSWRPCARLQYIALANNSRIIIA